MPSEPGWRKRGLPRVGGSVAATKARRPKRVKASQQSYEAFIDLDTLCLAFDNFKEDFYGVADLEILGTFFLLLFFNGSD